MPVIASDDAGRHCPGAALAVDSEPRRPARRARSPHVVSPQSPQPPSPGGHRAHRRGGVRGRVRRSGAGEPGAPCGRGRLPRDLEHRGSPGADLGGRGRGAHRAGARRTPAGAGHQDPDQRVRTRVPQRRRAPVTGAPDRVGGLRDRAGRRDHPGAGLLRGHPAGRGRRGPAGHRPFTRRVDGRAEATSIPQERTRSAGEARREGRHTRARAAAAQPRARPLR